MLNIVHQRRGKWWFWDEIWVHEMGPYNSEDEASTALKEYCINQLGLTEEQIGIKQDAFIAPINSHPVELEDIGNEDV